MLIDLFFSFLQIGLFGIGGGLVSVSLLMQQVVVEHQWVSATTFNDLIAIAESTPGPMVVNSATFVGMHIGGFTGAVIATFASVLPGFMIALTIALLYRRYRTLSPIQGAMNGLRPVIVALIFVGGVKVARNALFLGGLLSLGALDWFSFAIFIASLLVIKYLKPSAVTVILGGGVIGGVIRFFFGL